MQQLRNFLFGNTTLHYVEQGFPDSEAEAMSWLASQKVKGKFIGFTGGSFLAFCWGHYHERIQSLLRFQFSKVATLSAIVLGSVITSDYAFCVRRRGATNDYWTNKLVLNNNLFFANLDSLVENFNILNRKFTPQEIESFNDRRQAFKSNITNRKWIYNENVHTPEQFERRIKIHTDGVWSDKAIVQDIKKRNAGKEDLTVIPSKISDLLDHSGLKFGVPNERHPDWTPMRK